MKHTYRRDLARRTREAIKQLKDDALAIGREIDDLTNSLADLENQRQRRSPQRPKEPGRGKRVHQPETGTDRTRSRKKRIPPRPATTKRRKVAKVKVRDALEAAFAERQYLTTSEAKEVTGGASTTLWHLSNMLDDKKIVRAGIGQTAKGKAVPRYRRNDRELRLVAGEGTKRGRKRATA